MAVAAVNEASDVETTIDSITRARVAKEGRRPRSGLAAMLCWPTLTYQKRHHGRVVAGGPGSSTSQTADSPMSDMRLRIVELLPR